MIKHEDRISMTSTANLRKVLERASRWGDDDVVMLAEGAFDELRRRGVATFGDKDLLDEARRRVR